MEKNFEFDDVDDEELDFVRPHKTIPVLLHITAINKHNENEVNKMKMTKKDHMENLSDIMDSMPDDTCGDWRDSIAYAMDVIEKLDKDDDKLDFDKVNKKISVPLELIESIKTVEVLEKMKAEMKKWYFDTDVQSIAKDPCVVDAMIDLFIRTVNKYKENEVNKIKIIKDPTQSDIKERIMNREKYRNDTSYREGYDDGRKEGINSVATFTMRFLNMFSGQIEYMKKLLADATNGEEGSKE